MYSYTRLESLPLCNDNTCVRCLRNNSSYIKRVFLIIIAICAYLIAHFAAATTYYIVRRPYNIMDTVAIFTILPPFIIGFSILVIILFCGVISGTIAGICYMCKFIYVRYKEAGAEIAREKAAAAYSNNQ